MTYVTCRLTAGSGTLRSVIEYGLPLPFYYTLTERDFTTELK